MNKSLRGILVGCGVLAVLGGGLVVLNLTEPEEKPEESSEADETVSLWNVTSDAIARVTVEQAGGDSYTAYRKMEQVDDVDANGEAITKDIANYYLEGYDDLPMNTTSIRLLATRSYNVSSTRTIQTDTPVADLAKYGLDQPIAVTLEVDEVGEVKFLIGDIAPDSTLTYLCMANDPATVYTISSTYAEPYRGTLLSYLGTTLTEKQADDDTTIVKDVRVERSDLDYDFYFEYDAFYDGESNGGSSAVHVMREPIRCLLNAEKSASATHGLYGLTATEVRIPHPTAAELTQCGLDDPFVRVTAHTDDGKTTVFRLGGTYEAETDENTTETRYYGYLDGLDCIYGFSADDIVYEDMKPEDLTSKIIIETYVWDIGRLTYQADDVTLDFSMTGTSREDAVVKCNGVETDSERFRLLYTYLLKTAAEDLVLDAPLPTGEPLAQVKLERQDGKRSYDVAFYDAGGMKAYIAVNGEVCFKCRKSYVETLIENMQIYNDTSKDFNMTW